MLTILAYIFDISVVLYVLIKAKHSKYFCGVSRRTFDISTLWIFVFVYYVSYMFGFLEYNYVLDLFSILLLVVLHKTKNPNQLFSGPLKWYVFFFMWSCLRILSTTAPRAGFYMLVKLVLPLFFFKFASLALSTKLNIWLYIEKLASMPVLYFVISLLGILIGDYFPVYEYFGMAIFVMPFIMFLKTKEKKYLLYCVLCLSNNLVEIKRTPMIGITLMLALYFIFRYKMRAFVPIAASICIFIVSVLYVPTIRDRMFFEGVDITALDMDVLLSDEVFNIINTSGRSDMWSTVSERFYHNHQLFGVGTGTVKGFLLSKENDTGHFLRLHNDWLHILCEVGWIGTSMLIMFFISLIKKSYRVFTKYNVNEIRLVALACAMTCIGTMIHMLFENCVGVFGYYVPFVFAAMLSNYLRIENSKYE